MKTNIQQYDLPSFSNINIKINTRECFEDLFNAQHIHSKPTFFPSHSLPEILRFFCPKCSTKATQKQQVNPSIFLFII